jgi:hypothetical protein
MATPQRGISIVVSEKIIEPIAPPAVKGAKVLFWGTDRYAIGLNAVCVPKSSSPQKNPICWSKRGLLPSNNRCLFSTNAGNSRDAKEVGRRADIRSSGAV